MIFCCFQLEVIQNQVVVRIAVQSIGRESDA